VTADPFRPTGYFCRFQQSLCKKKKLKNKKTQKNQPIAYYIHYTAINTCARIILGVQKWKKIEITEI